MTREPRLMEQMAVTYATEIERLRAALEDLAERASEEGAHHLAKRARAALEETK